MNAAFAAFIVIAGVVGRGLYEQAKKRKAESAYLPPPTRAKAVSAQREWNGFLDARGANAFWSFGDSASDPDWVEVIIAPVMSGLTLSPKQYRPSLPAPPITIPWDTILSATRGTESSAPQRPGDSVESAAVIKLNLHALGEPGAYKSGDIAVIRCYGKTGSVLVTEVNKHLYGRVAPRPDPATRSMAPNLPPPPRKVQPSPSVSPRPAVAAPPPSAVPPPVYRPATTAAATAAVPNVTPVPAVAAPPQVDVPAPIVVSEPVAVSDAAGSVASDEAVGFGDPATLDLPPSNLDALTPATIELSTFDSPLDLTAYAPADVDEAVAPPLVAAPWPPPTAFVLPDSVKAADEQQ